MPVIHFGEEDMAKAGLGPKKEESEVQRLRKQLASYGDTPAAPDTELQGAQRGDELRNMVSDMGQIMSHAVTGDSGPAISRGTGAASLLARRDSAAKSAAAGRDGLEHKLKAAEGLEDNDPDSDASMLDQELIGKIAPGLAVQIKGMSSAQIRRTYPMLKEALDQNQARSKASAEDTRRLREAKEKRAQQLTDEASRRQYQSGENDKTRQANITAAGVKANAEADKVARESVEGLPVGVELVPGAHPTKEQRQKYAAAEVSREAMRSYISNMRALHKTYGTELTGTGAKLMKQELTKMKLDAKNIAELGALSGPDEALVQSIIAADPTSFMANAKAVFGTDDTGVLLNSLEKWLDDKVGAAAKSYGVRKKATTNALSPEEQAELDGLRKELAQ